MADPGKYGQIDELVNPLTLLKMIRSKDLVLLDARPREVFAQGRLPGAVSFPLVEADQNQAVLNDILRPGAPVVVYCSGADCQDSLRLAEKLAALGVPRVMVYSGGFSEWKEMGFEVVHDGP